MDGNLSVQNSILSVDAGPSRRSKSVPARAIAHAVCPELDPRKPHQHVRGKSFVQNSIRSNALPQGSLEICGNIENRVLNRLVPSQVFVWGSRGSSSGQIVCANVLACIGLPKWFGP